MATKNEEKKVTAPAAENKAEKKEETVKIKLERIHGQNDDQYVSVNNRTFLIKRGEYVEVPLCVAKVLESRERMLNTIYEFEETHAKG